MKETQKTRDNMQVKTSELLEDKAVHMLWGSWETINSFFPEPSATCLDSPSAATSHQSSPLLRTYAPLNIAVTMPSVLSVPSLSPCHTHQPCQLTLSLNQLAPNDIGQSTRKYILQDATGKPLQRELLNSTETLPPLKLSSPNKPLDVKTNKAWKNIWIQRR